jgi:ribosomal protein S12 methylthiotransferase
VSGKRGKVGLINLGCPKNQVDAEVMLGRLKAEGYDLTPDPEEADVIVVNTCGFIEAAKEESVEAILEAARLKTEGHLKRLVATGCLTQRYGKDLVEGIPELDAVVGTAGPDAIGGVLEKVLAPAPHGPLITIGAPGGAVDGRERIRVGPRHSAYLKIAEGCSKRCAFCVIPHLRGDLASRPIEEIEAETRALAAEGVVEVNLISQDTTNYGVDRYGRKRLADLIGRLSRVEGLRWLRLLYTYPTDYTDGLLTALAASDKVVPYIDLPLQHASDAVLKRMRRTGTRARLERLIERIRDRIPGVALRSSFIVGFPGETEAEFAALHDFIGEMRFDHLGVFTYSHEEGTPAYAMPDDVPDAVKAERRDALLEMQAEISREKLHALVGRTVPVLVDGLSKETDLLLEGRMPTQAPDIDGVVYINDTNDRPLDPGQIVEVEITEAHTYDVVGRIVQRMPRAR